MMIAIQNAVASESWQIGPEIDALRLEKGKISSRAGTCCPLCSTETASVAGGPAQA